MLRQYEAILIDEAHERSLNIDFILGCLRQLMEKRSDLKIVITSATIDTETFSQAFGGAPIIEVSGRMYRWMYITCRRKRMLRTISKSQPERLERLSEKPGGRHPHVPSRRARYS